MKKILVIEDEKPLRESILAILVLEGFETRGASTGRQGIQTACDYLPHVIIADIMMPEGDGFFVLSELRKRSSTATIPFIFLTARSNWEDMRHGMELGADDYIPKPFRSQDLIAAVKTQLEKQAQLENMRLRALSHYLVEAQETEHRRIAHELHNDVGQLLQGLKITLGISKRLPSHAVGAVLEEAEHIVDVITGRLNLLSRALRPSILDELGLLPALHQFIEHHPITKRGHVDFKHNGLEQRFAEEIETTLYRIVQKTLDEIARNTLEANIRLHIERNTESLRVEIEDRSSSIDPKTTFTTNPTTIFAEMIERITLLGGQLMVETTPELYTRIAAQLPLTQYAGDGLTAPNNLTLPPPLPNTSGSTAPLEERERGEAPVKAPTHTITSNHDSALQVVLADSHDWMRQGLRTLFDATQDITVVGELARLSDVVDMCMRQRPDILIIDPSQPDGNPLDMLSVIKQYAPQTQILVLSMQADANYIADVFRNGVTGYALKESRASDLIQAIYTVAKGERYLSPSLIIDTIDTYLHPPEQSIQDEVADILTQREIEVLQLIVEGHKNTEIAELLSISPRTVETHRANMMRKLDLRTPATLIRYALEHNLTEDN